ncbi:MAG: SPOR domain-containing protein [Thalassospira sp.]|uniref:SPOR domain-containing protein n=1 Tax=Thalassospira sp. TaxID=1912094 RepID=UPI0032F06CA3
MKKILVVLAPLALSACGGPIELTVAKLAGDLISYVTTGKSTTDHAVSFVAEQDCALHRPFMDEDICKDDDLILAEEPAALADLGAPEIKKEIRAARPEIYAVNAPAENWSRPENGAAKVIVKTDLPPRAPVAETKAVEVAAATEQFGAEDLGAYGTEVSNVPDPQGEADAAIAGYVPDAKIVPKKQPETVTAALVDATVMTDDVDQLVTPIDVKTDGDGLAGDVLSTPLPGDYVVLASFSNQVRAQKALALYEEYQPRLLDAKVDGQAYLRVAVGPLSAQHAHDLRLLAAKKGIKDPWIVGVAATGE